MQNSTPEQGNSGSGNSGIIQRAKDYAPFIVVVVVVVVIAFAMIR